MFGSLLGMYLSRPDFIRLVGRSGCSGDAFEKFDCCFGERGSMSAFVGSTDRAPPFPVTSIVRIEGNNAPSLELITSLLMKLIAIACVFFDASSARDITATRDAARRLLSDACHRQRYRVGNRRFNARPRKFGVPRPASLSSTYAHEKIYRCRVRDIRATYFA